MFAYDIVTKCFYDGGHILSAIAKSLDHFLGEGERQNETGEGGVGERR